MRAAGALPAAAATARSAPPPTARPVASRDSRASGRDPRLRNRSRGSLPLARESRLATGRAVGGGAERAVAAAAGSAPAARMAQGAPHAAVELRALRGAGEARRALFLSAQRRPAESER